MCQLFSELSDAKDKVVRISGKVHTWAHGTVLFETGCTTRFETEGHAWPTAVHVVSPERAAIDGYKVGFERHEKSFDPLAAFYEKSEPFVKGFLLGVTVEGQLRLREKYVAVMVGGEMRGNGFGPLAMAPAQLVVKRIVEVRVEKVLTKADAELKRK